MNGLSSARDSLGFEVRERTGVQDKSWGRQGQYRREAIAIVLVVCSGRRLLAFRFVAGTGIFMVGYGLTCTQRYLEPLRFRLLFTVLSSTLMCGIVYEILRVTALNSRGSCTGSGRRSASRQRTRPRLRERDRGFELGSALRFLPLLGEERWGAGPNARASGTGRAFGVIGASSRCFWTFVSLREALDRQPASRVNLQTEGITSSNVSSRDGEARLRTSSAPVQAMAYRLYQIERRTIRAPATNKGEFRCERFRST